MTTSPDLNHAPVLGPDGKTAYRLVPADEYARLTRAARPRSRARAGPSDAAVADALSILADPATTWHDANDVVFDIVRRGLKQVRRELGLTQAELGKLLRLPQPRVSRIENNPDAISLRLLKRIARILAKQPTRSGGSSD